MRADDDGVCERRSRERRVRTLSIDCAIRRKSRQQVTLALAVRPFQVNPPAQFLNTAGGVSPIQDLAFENERRQRRWSAGVFPRTQPRTFRAVTLAADTPCDWLPTQRGSARIHDDSGLRVGCAAVRRRSAAGAESGDRARSAAACGAAPDCAAASLDERRSAVAREAQSRRADRAAEGPGARPTRCAPRSRTC